jgi:hypothetical protein
MFHRFNVMPIPGMELEDLPRGRFQGPDYDDLPEGMRDRLGQFHHYESPDRFHRGYDPGWKYPSSKFFSPFTALVKLLFLGFIAWLLYKVVTLFSAGRNWQLSFQSGAEEAEEEVKPSSRSKKT